MPTNTPFFTTAGAITTLTNPLAGVLQVSRTFTELLNESFENDAAGSVVGQSSQKVSGGPWVFDGTAGNLAKITLDVAAGALINGAKGAWFTWISNQAGGTLNNWTIPLTRKTATGKAWVFTGYYTMTAMTNKGPAYYVMNNGAFDPVAFSTSGIFAGFKDNGATLDLLVNDLANPPTGAAAVVVGAAGAYGSHKMEIDVAANGTFAILIDGVSQYTGTVYNGNQQVDRVSIDSDPLVAVDTNIVRFDTMRVTETMVATNVVTNNFYNGEITVPISCSAIGALSLQANGLVFTSPVNDFIWTSVCFDQYQQTFFQVYQLFGAAGGTTFYQGSPILAQFCQFEITLATDIENQGVYLNLTQRIA